MPIRLDLDAGPLADEMEPLSRALDGIAANGALAAGRVPRGQGRRIAWMGCPPSGPGDARGATDVLVTGPEAAAAVETAHGVEVHEVAPGVDRETFSPDLERLRTGGDFVFLARARWGAGWEAVLPAFSAEFSPADRVGLLALIDCADPAVDLRAEIGALDLPRGRAPIVAWVDAHLPRDEWAATLRSADAFLAIGCTDGFWMEARRAMACGVPVVAPAGRDCPLDEETGLVLASLEIAPLRQALRRAAEDRAETRAMGTRAAQRAEDWDWPKVAARIHDLL